MADIKVNRDSKLIKVLAAQARRERVDSAAADEAAEIIKELAQDLNPQNRHEIAQTMAYAIEELQQHELDFMNSIADVKSVGYGDKAAFNLKVGDVKAYMQAKGSTTARSYVASKQVLVDTHEISARPAINIVDLRVGRVNMADLIRDANYQMTTKKMMHMQKVLHAAIENYASPFYATGNGVSAPVLDKQLQYFRRFGNVAIVGDMAAVGQLSGLAGMAMNASMNQFSNEQINEVNDKGFMGRYKGCEVIAMNNAYDGNSIEPALAANWLYLIPSGMSGDSRNLKLVNEGGIITTESQNIDDLTYEVRLDSWFGAAFIVGNHPTIGAYCIN